MTVYKCTPLELLEVELREAEKAQQDIELRLQVLRGQVEVKRAQEARKSKQQEQKEMADREVEILQSSEWTPTVEHFIQNILSNVQVFGIRVQKGVDLPEDLPAPIVQIRSDALEALRLLRECGSYANKDAAYSAINEMERVALEGLLCIEMRVSTADVTTARELVKRKAIELRKSL